MAGARDGEGPGRPPRPDPLLRLEAELGRIDEQLQALGAARGRIEGLLGAVVAITREVELPAVLNRIVTTAMELVGARFGALGVLDDSGERLSQFIPVGLSEQERAALAGVGFPAVWACSDT